MAAAGPAGAAVEHVQDPVPGRYLASAVTPPGPAVHRMCGDSAARVALREVVSSRGRPPLPPPGRPAVVDRQDVGL